MFNKEWQTCVAPGRSTEWQVADLENKCVRTSYPITGDKTKLKDNQGQAIRRAEGLEKSVKKRGLIESYNDAFQEIK